MPTLYKHQAEDVAWVQERHALGQRSHWITSDPGVGKSVSASAVCLALSAKRVLIVCPSGVRPNWKGIVGTWLPNHSYAALLKGPRASDSAPEKFRLEQLRSADVVIVTPELLHTVERQWDVVIFDEMHQLVHASAKLYKQLRALRTEQPEATFLGLSGTPLSTDPVQVWTLLDLFFPGVFGKGQKSGDPPHKWKLRFQESVPSDYSYSGVAFRGLRPDAAPALQSILNAVSRRVLREDLGDILPPVDFRPYEIPFDDSRTDTELALAKLDVLTRETPHVAVFTVHHAPAGEILSQLRQLPRYRDVAIAYLDGTYSAEQRAETLARLANAPRSLLVGTIEAMGTGIDLTYVGQYLIAEPNAQAPDVIQLDGRFRRLSNLGAPAAIGHMLFREGRDDAQRRLLVERMTAYESVLRTSKSNQQLRDALTIKQTPVKAARMWDRILTGALGDFTTDDLEIDDDDLDP